MKVAITWRRLLPGLKILTFMVSETGYGLSARTARLENLMQRQQHIIIQEKGGNGENCAEAPAETRHVISKKYSSQEAG